MQKLFNHISIYLLLCASTFSSTAYAARSEYKLIDLGLQESDQSEAVAVNDIGQIAGTYTMLGGKYYFMWNEIEGIRLIDLPETAVIVTLNNAGQIAGNYKDSLSKDRGFFWDTQHGFLDIGTLGGYFTRVCDMNDLGQIVGESECANSSLVNEQKERHAFMWQDGFITDLGALPGDLGIPGDQSIATGINNFGEIIGMSNFLIAHKGKMLRKHNRCVYWHNGIINEIDNNSLEHPCVAIGAFTINNQSLAIYEDNVTGYFVFDLVTQRKIMIPFAQNLSRIPEIAENGDIFLFPKDYSGYNRKCPADVVYFKKNNSSKDYSNWNLYDYAELNSLCKYPHPWKPNSFEGALDFNNNRWVVGVARNIYGEQHAMLLVPDVK